MTIWNDKSGVYACPECEGRGVVASHRQATINDPYPEAPCPNGCAEHSAECPVCGFGVTVPGYDCYACYTVDGLVSRLLTDDVRDDLLASIGRAWSLAQAEASKQ